MELGSLEIQIFVGLVVVLGTAFVALVCDFLKGNNEQLRERNVELRVRQDERDRLGLSNPAQWLHGLAALIRNPVLVDAVAADTGMPVVPAPAPRVTPEPRPEPRVAPEPVQPDERGSGSRQRYEQERGDRQTSWASKEELGELAERAARIRARHEASVRRYEAEHAAQPLASQPLAGEPTRLKVLSFERFDNRETLDLHQEMERVAGLSQPEAPAAETAADVPARPVVDTPDEPVAAPPPVEAPVEVARTPAQVVVRDEAASDLGIDPVPAGMLPVLPAAVGAALVGGPAVDVGGQQPLWSAAVVKPEVPPADFDLFDNNVFESEAFDESPATVDAETVTSPVVHLVVPAGFHDASVMASLLENQAPYTGVIVAIGINDYDSIREKLALPAGIEAFEAVNRMILSMLRQNDFACRSLEDEFLLLFPGETGASAQRRLFQVSEKLWDFQLRSLGNLSLMFSWGGYDVAGEHLVESVACARERMFQTKHSRKPAPLDLSLFRKRVVNG